MTKIKNILLWAFMVVASLTTLSSCNTLDLAPQDWYGSESFWQNKVQVESAMIGLHYDLREDYGMLFALGEARGSSLKTGTASLGGANMAWSSPIKDNTLRAGNTGVSSWYGLYTNLLHVNLFIKNVTEADYLTAQEASFYLGQAYGLRAYYYFWLYRTFGGVPIVTSVKILDGKIVASDLYTARSSAKETLDFIKSDINTSEEYFANDYTQESTKAMWSLSATLALKGEIYLWSSKVSTGDFNAVSADALIAQEALSKLIGRYGLESDFQNVFSQKGNNEVIMTMRFEDGEKSNSNGQWLSDPNYFINQAADENGDLITTDVLEQNGSGGTFYHEYKRGLYDAFDDEDSRKHATFYAFYYERAEDDLTWNKSDQFKGLLVRKNIGIVNLNGVRVFEGDIHIYRYADVLLLMAEVENMLGGSVSSYINQVRARGYGDNWDSSLYGYVDESFAENERAILLERDREFVQEGKRWFDVVRLRDSNGKSLVFNKDVNYYTTLGETLYPIISESDSHMLLWPIDNTTLSNDPLLVQTTGY
ncbi:MAG: RagB/SusD family nutrient uptake outer membrane protein [Rikenellaceae bacterium]